MPEFRALEPQSPINPLADAYGEECLGRSRKVARDTRCELDIRYGDTPAQSLDVYLPDNATATDMPVLVFFHGGGFTHGYKEWCGFMAPALTAHPAIFVSADYRLLPNATYPEAIEDAVAAVKWVHDNIARHGGSPDRIFVGGHSAGALLAALLVTDRERVNAGGLDPASIKASFPISGTFTRDGMSGQMGYEVPTGPLVVEPRSPIALARHASAPLFLTWGGAERQLERVERSALQLMNAVRDGGRPVDWLYLPEADHFGTHLDTGDPNGPWVAKVRAWFEARPTRLTGDRP